jgi:hypothetical protein
MTTNHASQLTRSLALFSESANNHRGHCASAASLGHDLSDLRIRWPAAALTVLPCCLGLRC